MSNIKDQRRYRVHHNYFNSEMAESHFDTISVIEGYQNVVDYCQNHTDWHDYVCELFENKDFSNEPFYFESDLEIIEFAQITTRQIITLLNACDAEYEDNLDFCLLTFNEKVLSEIIDTHHNWQRLFPRSSEIRIEDENGIADFLTADEDEVLSTKDEEISYRIIPETEDLIQITEDDNHADTWDLTSRQIAITKTHVKFIGKYSTNWVLNGAFTASAEIPIYVLRSLLTELQGEQNNV